MSAQNLAGMFWSRLEDRGVAPAQMVKRQGQWRRRGEVADFRGLIDEVIAVRYWSEEL